MDDKMFNYNFSGQKIIVLGLARSGTAIAKILNGLGANVIVNDAKQEEKCIEKNELESLGIKVICGEHPQDLVDKSVSLVVKNPGIPYSIIPIQTATALKIPVITEVEIAYQLSEAPFIGITGSNGKTTTTTLIGEIIKSAGQNVIVAGNIGTVLSEKAKSATNDQVLVTELSSFQLKGTVNFKPHIAVLLNIYSAHLDYHQTIEDYIKSKAKIFANQDSGDFAILNADCEKCRNLIPDINSKIYLFSAKNPIDLGAYIKEGIIYWKENDQEIEVLSINEVQGIHPENVLAAIIATKLYGIQFNIIRNVIKNFKGVEHRLEFVATHNGISFYNDSKATNPQATINALKTFAKPVVLIAGGLDRGINFEELIDSFKKKVKALITYGQTAEKLNTVAKIAGIEIINTVDNVNEATLLANSIAKNGDTVLLSPACASWDMYASFEERGRIFKEVVHKLI